MDDPAPGILLSL
jgi:predicted Zn-dependent protease